MFLSRNQKKKMYTPINPDGCLGIGDVGTNYKEMQVMEPLTKLFQLLHFAKLAKKTSRIII